MGSIECARKIIEKKVEFFLKEIRRRAEKNPATDIWTRKPNFEMLEPASSSFYLHEYYESLLEWYIRDYLVCPMLRDLFECFGIECMWPIMNKIVPFQHNGGREMDYPFQFIISRNGRVTGYKYEKCAEIVGYAELFERRFQFVADNHGRMTGYRFASSDTSKRPVDYLKRIMIYNQKVDNIVILDWSLDGVIKRQNVKRVSIITFAGFAKKLFGKQLGEYIVGELKKAVKTAKEEIGLQTVSNLSLRNLSQFTEDLMKELKDKNYEKLRYRVLYIEKDKDPEGVKEKFANMNLPEKDYSIVSETYGQKELYKALVGNQGFAKCFVTAEYLYNVFKDNKGCFDYSSIVCGYLKAVEQLVYRILKINLMTVSANDEFWIKGQYPDRKKDKDFMSRKNPENKKVTQVRFLECNEKSFDISLTPMIWFLKDNNRYKLSKDGVEVVHEILLKYAQECRNDHFHKDNITDFDEIVEGIRNNTFLVLFLLLGGCTLSGNEKTDMIELGVMNDSFTRLYKELLSIPRTVKEFCVRMNGEDILAMRLWDQGDVGYDQYGYISKSTIKFVRVENYTRIEDEPEMKVDFELSADNMPEKIWYYRSKERVLIEW